MPDSVSVVIPSYNHDKYIGIALESVLNQTRRPQELIVIDDGSSDRSKQIIESFRLNFKKKGIDFITKYRSNLGAHHTINEAIELASSKWISILNSDDYYMPNRIFEMLKAVKNKKSELAFSLVMHVDESGNALPDTHAMRSWYVDEINILRKNIAFNFLYHNIGITTGNIFMTKSLWKKTGGFRNFLIVHDYDFFLRSMNFTSLLLVKKNLIGYRIHSSNTIFQHDHLLIQEGVEMIGELFRDIILNEGSIHREAPWSSKNLKEFKNFWQEKKGSAIRHWLGDVDLFDCFY